MAKQTYTKDERKAQFLKAGLAIAKKDGIAKVSVAAVAQKCSVTAPLVFHCFGARSNLQLAIKKEAKKQGIKLPDSKGTPPAKKPAVARKRSVAEVKAIKNKVAAPKVRTVSRSAKSGKFVDKATVKSNPDTTVTQKFKQQPVPQGMPTEPKASL